MMKIEDLTQADITRKVIYTPYPGGAKETGVITSYNERFVFVRYGSDTGSKATPPDKLEFEFNQPKKH